MKASTSLRSTKKQGLAVTPPRFDKVEGKSTGGITVVAQRTELAVLDLMMDYEIDGIVLKAGKAKILVKGDAGLTPWAKKRYSVGDVEFVLCPESDVIAFTAAEA